MSSVARQPSDIASTVTPRETMQAIFQDSYGGAPETVLPPDPHNFDGDHDGIGCES